MQQGDPTVEQCCIDELATPAGHTLMQRQKNPDDRIEASCEVDHGYSDPGRRPVRIPVDTHKPRHRLYNRVVAWQAAKRAIRTEPRNTAVDQPREALCKVLLPNSPPFQRAYLEVLDKHICRLEQPEEGITPRFLIEIENNSALVAVDPDKVRGRITRERRPPCARVVTLRWFHLDYFRTVVAKNLRTEGSAQNTAQVHHAQTGKRPGGLEFLHGLTCQ